MASAQEIADLLGHLLFLMQVQVGGVVAGKLAHPTAGRQDAWTKITQLLRRFLQTEGMDGAITLAAVKRARLDRNYQDKAAWSF